MKITDEESNNFQVRNTLRSYSIFLEKYDVEPSVMLKWF